MPPRVEARFEESWILGEEGGITSTNDHGVHLRIVARAIMAAGTGTGTAGTRSTRNKSRKLGRGKASASASASRQFDLFIDGRSYFDLPLLDETTGDLVAAPIASTYTSTCTGNGFDDSASTKTGSYEQVEEDEEDEEEEVHEEGAHIEDWTANGSAIASNDDTCKDDDLDSVDGFMANIDLSGKHEDGDLPVHKSSKGFAISASASGESHNKSAARGHRMASAKSNFQRSTARTAEKIGSSTKKGTKKLVAGTSKVFTSPIALIKRTSTDNRKGGGGGSFSSDDEKIINTCADGNAVDYELGNGTDPPATDADTDAVTNTPARPSSDNGKGEDSRRLNHSTIASFSELHNTMMPASASTGAPQRKETGGQVNEEDAPDAEEIIAQLREQIFHLEREIAHNADRVAAEVERSVAISEIEARMVRERDQGEIMRLQNELNEMQKEAKSQAKDFQDELELAKIEAEKLKDIAKAAELKSNELQTKKETAEEEIVRLKERMSTLEEALVRARTVKSSRRKGAPFVSNDQITSYLDNPKCCLCCKDATENMKDCQCGKDACGLQAHVSCLIGSNHHPTPSVSHPGTPAPTLPLILCGGIFQK